VSLSTASDIVPILVPRICHFRYLLYGLCYSFHVYATLAIY